MLTKILYNSHISTPLNRWAFLHAKKHILALHKIDDAKGRLMVLSLAFTS